MKRVITTLAVAFFCYTEMALAQQVFSGDWDIVKSENAPWLLARPELKAFPEAFLHKAHFSFQANQLIAPSWIGCKKPTYEMMSLDYTSLFEGDLYDPGHGLNNATEMAQKLGFVTEPVMSMQTSCSELLFHLLNQDTVMFGLNNMIYTLKRSNVGKK